MVIGNVSGAPLIEQRQNRCGTNRGANWSDSASHADGAGTVAATVVTALTDLSSSLTPSIMLEAFMGIYATGFMELPITAATGTVATEMGSKLITAATGFLTRLLIMSTKDCMRVLYVDGLGELLGHFGEQ
jgi:hypothetical protein